MSRLTKTSVQLDMVVMHALQLRFPELTASEIVRLSLEYVQRRSKDIGLQQENVRLVDLGEGSR